MASLTKTRGFTLIEIVVAIALLMVIVIGGLSANNLTTTTVSINKQRSQANLLAREALEALQSIRAANFLSLTTGPFHPVLDESGWHLEENEEQIGEFIRVITLSSVMRGVACSNPICEIVSGGGITDLNSLKAEVKVTWKENNQDKQYTLNTLLTYWR